MLLLLLSFGYFAPVEILNKFTKQKNNYVNVPAAFVTRYKKKMLRNV